LCIASIEKVTPVASCNLMKSRFVPIIQTRALCFRGVFAAEISEEWNRVMKSHGGGTGDNAESNDRSPASEDVAGFFPWANLAGSKYRDYSASREQSRADSRDRGKVERSRPVADGKQQTVPHDERDSVHPNRSSSSLPIAESNLATMPGSRRSTARRQTQDESSRWVALKRSHRTELKHHEEDTEARIDLPTVAFFSLAGGTGKTSLAASVGCLLAAEGESSLLVDTHSYGLLQLFFGAREIRAGASRAFVSANSAPVRVMALDLWRDEGEFPPIDQIAQHLEGMNRILIDISTASLKLLREILPLAPTVVIVLAPDMASVVSLQSLQREFQRIEEETDQKIDAVYLLNRFDPSLRLHRDIRDRLARQLGKRLLPILIHRSHAVSEALAGGMTIVDYAPDVQTVDDLRELAQWVRGLEVPATIETQDMRWGER
jgi:cellulose biosynthesis protein BcsQ